MTRFHCPISASCGGCHLLSLTYSEQLSEKEKRVRLLLEDALHPAAIRLSPSVLQPILGMEEPTHYRTKVHHVFCSGKSSGPQNGGGQKKSGHTAALKTPSKTPSKASLCVSSGIYAAGTHHVCKVEDCLLEDVVCQQIIHTIEGLAASFRLSVYDEDRRTGLLRHVLVRRGHYTGEIMVILVVADPVFPSRRNFVKALTDLHPEITTVVQNFNDRRTTFVLGAQNTTLYGPGFIYERILGHRFRLSPLSFFQVNPVQTQRLYQTAIELAALSAEDTVIDAYCGTGTIGLCAAPFCREVIGVELNASAVTDARRNAHDNAIENARFEVGDAGEFLRHYAAKDRSSVVFLDPPRSGSSPEFLKALLQMAPDRIVYISCSPDTLARDVAVLCTQNAYRLQTVVPVDMFPMTEHVETIALLQRENS